MEFPIASVRLRFLGSDQIPKNGRFLAAAKTPAA